MDWLLVLLNVITALVFIALATYANVCLLRRDDANIERLILVRRMDRQTSRLRTNRRAIKPSGSAAALTGATSAQSFHAAVGSPSQASASRTSFADDTISVTDSYNGEPEQDDHDVGLFENRSSIGSDLRCWFSMLVVISSWTEGTTDIILLLSSEVDLNGQRGEQDMMVTPAILSVYLTFSGLLLILIYLVEKEVLGGGSSAVDRMNSLKVTLGVVAALIAPLVLCFGLVAGGVWAAALEVYSTVAEFTLSLAFGVASIKLPRKVLSFGQEMSPVATKIRRVCVAVSVCMFCRGVLILPPVQNALGALGDYAILLLEMSTAIPLLLSLMLLHQQAS